MFMFMFMSMRACPVTNENSWQPFLSAASFLFFIGLWGFVDFFVPSAREHRTFPSDDVSSWFGGTRLRDQALWYIAPLVVRRLSKGESVAAPPGVCACFLCMHLCLFELLRLCRVCLDQVHVCVALHEGLIVRDASELKSRLIGMSWLAS